MNIQNFTQSDIRKLQDLLSVGEKSSIESTMLFQKACTYCSALKYIPGILMIGVGNSVAMGSAHEKSDIDLFVVTKSGNMWFIRIIMTLFFGVLGQRKTSKNHASKFCLSFFVTEKSLDLSPISIQRDIYLFYRILTLKPIFSCAGTYDDFLKQNCWANFSDFSELFQKQSFKICGAKRKTTGKISRALDTLFQKIFLKRTFRKYIGLGRPDGVIIHDNMLKFHDQDKRKILSDQVFRVNTGKKGKDV